MINIQSDSIMRQMNKVHLLSYTTMNNEHIFITSYFSLPYHTESISKVRRMKEMITNLIFS